MAQIEFMADRPVVLTGAASAFKDIAECFNTFHDKVKEAHKAKKGAKEKAPPPLKRVTDLVSQTRLEKCTSIVKEHFFKLPDASKLLFSGAGRAPALREHGGFQHA